MEDGRPSETAVLVCLGRAVAHGRSTVARYADPTAMALLPDDEARARAEVARGGVAPRGLRARLRYEYVRGLADMMVPRTVFIDDAITAAAAPQLVILGAGLDGRAWRMPSLADVTVFEVDHPASQRAKQARVGALARTARDVRFVPVDFTRDSLDAALAAAGHDASRPTMWVLEGVVMYLTRAEVEATLRVVAARSAPRSHVVIAYHVPAFVRRILGMFLRFIGEPLRSASTASEMQAQLARHGFRVVDDADMGEIGARMGADLARLRRFTHGRMLDAIHD